MASYDYIIVGAGPVGLTIAWLLSQSPSINRILIIDRENVIGGCHRVRRYRGLFTEHGPRIYSNIYLNMTQVLQDMNIPFNKIFTPYNFSSGSMSSDIIKKLSFREIFLLAIEYFKLVFNPLHGQDISVADFLSAHDYSEQSRDLLNRLCRLTDGAGINRYTMFELLSGFDQHVFYTFAQPRRPNDVYLFPMWQSKLEATGKVSFLLNTTVNGLNHYNGRTIGVNIGNGNGAYDIISPNVVLAIPPTPVVKILRGLTWNGIDLTKFWNASKYDVNIPIIFHWDRKLVLPKVWGFPSTDWGVISILLSDYTQFDEPESQTVITTCITLTDNISSKTHKTANQTVNKNDVINEVFRQLSDVYGGLPTPTMSIMSPEMYRDAANGKWQSIDDAFVLTPKGGFIKEQAHRDIKGLYWVGTHNGYSYYHFTSMESAVSNAMTFVNSLPNSTFGGVKKMLLQKPVNFSTVLRYVIAVVIIVLVVILMYRKIIYK